MDVLNSKKRQKIFIPLTIDKRFWNKDMPNVFLNKVYEAQIGPEDKDIQYTTLHTYNTYAKDEKFQDFCSRLIYALGEVLNQYHGLHESKHFWRAMLWFWVQEYAASVQFKVEQLSNLQKQYPEEEYIYFADSRPSWNLYRFALETDVHAVFVKEDYHFMGYSWLAQKHFNFDIEKKEIHVLDNGEGLNDAVSGKTYIIRGIARVIKTLIVSCWNATVPSCMYVGLYNSQNGFYTSIKWFLRSHGAIQEISIPIKNRAHKIDINFRDNLSSELQRIVKSKTEKMIVAFLPYVFPVGFVETFREQYDAASGYLKKHNNLVFIQTSTAMLEVGVGKICMLLLKKRGGKIAGQQHGGTHQITPKVGEKFREREWNDIFYYWGRSALSYPKDGFPDCKISYGPSYKFCQGSFWGLSNWMSITKRIILKEQNATGFFLFVGTAIEAYPRHFNFGNVDCEKEEYIERKLQFFSSLSEQSRDRMIVREYPMDYGWHLPQMINKRWPDLRFSIHEHFNKMLSECDLFIADHLSTTWLEAVYFEKPTIFLLPDHEISIQDYKYRKEEKEYLEMLEKVGVIIHSPAEAAELVNYLAENGVMEWWLDKERQNVMKLVRDRWTTTVEDIDDWWYHELIEQARVVDGK